MKEEYDYSWPTEEEIVAAEARIAAEDEARATVFGLNYEYV